MRRLIIGPTWGPKDRGQLLLTGTTILKHGKWSNVSGKRHRQWLESMRSGDILLKVVRPWQLTEILDLVSTNVCAFRMVS